MKINNLIINHNKSIKDSYKKIDKNKMGIIFITDNKNKIIGCASDGDIRTKLVNGVKLNDKISLCINKNFTKSYENTNREDIIKLFDNNIKVIPVLNKNNELIKVLTPSDFPLDNEKTIIARSKSPVRISFGGGGSDLTHYFINSPGAVINATISLYTHSSLIKRNDKKVKIFSEDLKKSLESPSLKEALSNKGDFGLILSIIDLIKPKFGFELFIRSDFPISSGLGGSAVVISSIIGCFNEFRIDKWSKYEIAEMAYQAERLLFNVSGGWQDQYATVFGGINFMEFRKSKNIIHSLKIDRYILSELQANLILCDTCSSHNSSKIHDDQKKHLNNTDDVKKLVQKNVNLTYEIRNALLKGELNKIGQYLNKAWSYKRKFSKKITNNRLNKIYDTAIKFGATGGKLLGAGGGGFFLFYCNPINRDIVCKNLKKLKTKIINFSFDHEGLSSWRVRD
tara:strand:+ start:4569 stop:5930 length:1362 start_codon:yes stop_codon:yes gene_type:complete